MIKTPPKAHTVKLRDSRRRPDVTPEGKESPLRKDLLKVSCQENRPTCYLPSFCPPTCPPTCYECYLKWRNKGSPCTEVESREAGERSAAQQAYYYTDTDGNTTILETVHPLSAGRDPRDIIFSRKQYGTDIIIPRNDLEWHLPVCPNCEDNLDCQCERRKA